MSLSPAFEPRAVCARCGRPARVCYCAHVTSIPTRTRVVLLQHPRERHVPVGTAKMASLCLPNSELHVGIHWRDSPVLARALSEPSRPAALLYPGPGAVDVLREPPKHPVTLVVIDGTWAQASKVVRENPELAALPRYAFTPPSPSEYRIRREPHDAYVSTIEALAYVLGALEGDAARMQALLAPFHAMVDAQVRCAETIRGARVRHKKPSAPGPRVPLVLRDRAEDLVCVVGEANAWPYGSKERDRGRDGGFPDELVQWAAFRPSTGETFEAVARPRSPLAPSTPIYVQIARDELLAADPLDMLLEGWSSFARGGDVICSWGRYASRLFVSEGGWLPDARVDLRQVGRQLLKGKVGTIEDFLGAIGVAHGPPLARGRAGLRLSQVRAVVAHCAGLLPPRSVGLDTE